VEASQRTQTGKCIRLVNLLSEQLRLGMTVISIIRNVVAPSIHLKLSRDEDFHVTKLQRVKIEILWAATQMVMW
jgi:hypothetical protein